MKDKVIAVVSRVMNVPAAELNEDSSPDTVRGWDSLKHMNLVLALEEELGVQFSDTQIVEMNSVGLILEILKEIKR
jgi:acyl carrier protein